MSKLLLAGKIAKLREFYSDNYASLAGCYQFHCEKFCFFLFIFFAVEILRARRTVSKPYWILLQVSFCYKNEKEIKIFMFSCYKESENYDSSHKTDSKSFLSQWNLLMSVLCSVRYKILLCLVVPGGAAKESHETFILHWRSKINQESHNFFIRAKI